MRLCVDTRSAVHLKFKFSRSLCCLGGPQPCPPGPKPAAPLACTGGAVRSPPPCRGPSVGVAPQALGALPGPSLTITRVSGTQEVVDNSHSLDKPGGRMHAGAGGDRRQSLGAPGEPRLGPRAVPLGGERNPDPWGAQPQLPLTATQQGRGGQGSGSGQNLSLSLRDLCPWTFAPNF